MMSINNPYLSFAKQMMKAILFIALVLLRFSFNALSVDTCYCVLTGPFVSFFVFGGKHCRHENALPALVLHDKSNIMKVIIHINDKIVVVICDCNIEITLHRFIFIFS